MQTFASGSLLQTAVQVIQVAGQHPDRLRQHPDTGKNRRQSHGPLAADLLSGIGVVGQPDSIRQLCWRGHRCVTFSLK
ncbi:hypothetical protein BvCmsHHNP002_00774 [Escherichia coli]|nr:hypothetical protein BvCmsHHNP002_00774 [Escherichia coli]GCR86399.1 hypothetical protein BvCmsHHNP004_02157 [Escherichia coli]